ncbi:MAG TPA: hypothetical protein VFE58_04405 [Tepidisphaeraceae bacterium]|jgi:hypothetical protein|nr:hypothetical protein [Tepidisphaeraceae bacterium]
MSASSEKRLTLDLKRLAEVKKTKRNDSSPLGPDLLSFFKKNVAKRQTKFGQIADCWSHLIPEFLDQHCCLESFHRGHLTILVDSSSHLYELRQLLLSGLQQQLLLACKSTGLRKISLKPGRWYDPAENGSQKLRFD